MRIAISTCLVCLVLAGFVTAQQSGSLDTPVLEVAPAALVGAPPDLAPAQPAPTDSPALNPLRINPSRVDLFAVQPLPDEPLPPTTSSVGVSGDPASAGVLVPRRSNAGSPSPADFGDARNNTLFGSDDLQLAPRPAVELFDPDTGRVTGAYVGGAPNSAFSPRSDSREVAANTRVTRAMNALRTVSPDNRVQAQQELQTALEDLFEIRTASREDQIVALQKRLETLRQQLNERTAKKTEIVRLRVQTLVNEANGLGF